MYKEDLSLNNLQMLICYKTKPNLTNQSQEEIFLLFSKYLFDIKLFFYE